MSTKPVPAYLRALGARPIPETITLEGRTYSQVRVFKNDFFAVTALYEDAGRRVLVKIGRQASFLGLPMRWVGRLLARREAVAMTVLSGLPGIPRLLCRWGDTGIIREFIEGHPLSKGEHVNDDFHDRLSELIEAIHRKGMAYVDLEKCENVLIGNDGRPYLFDFQIAWYWPRAWGGELWPIRVIRGWFQSGDRYHLVKLRRRTRPDQLTPQQLSASYQKPWYVRFQRVITAPFQRIRRAILAKIDPRRQPGERGRVSL